MPLLWKRMPLHLGDRLLHVLHWLHALQQQVSARLAVLSLRSAIVNIDTLWLATHCCLCSS